MSSRGRRQWIAALVLVLIVAGTAIAAAGCGGQASAANGPMKLTEADNGKTVTLKVGDEMQVLLAGNPTTGYSWTTSLSAADKTVVQQQGEPAYAQQSTDRSVVGSGGTFTFTFKATATGQVAVKFGYARPFESVPPIQTFAVTVIVK
jgi:inhibitor of cysteine peptidase